MSVPPVTTNLRSTMPGMISDRASAPETFQPGGARPWSGSKSAPAERRPGLRRAPRCPSCQARIREADYCCAACGLPIRVAEVLVRFGETALRFRAVALGGVWRAQGRGDGTEGATWHQLADEAIDPYNCLEAAIARTARRLTSQLGLDARGELVYTCEVPDSSACFRIRVGPIDGSGRLAQALLEPFRGHSGRQGSVGLEDLWLMTHPEGSHRLEGADRGTCLGLAVSYLLRQIDGMSITRIGDSAGPKLIPGPERRRG